MKKSLICLLVSVCFICSACSDANTKPIASKIEKQEIESQDTENKGVVRIAVVTDDSTDSSAPDSSEDSSMDSFEEEEMVDIYEDYILINSDTEFLDESDLYHLNAEGCKLARNEIYARHGRLFKDIMLQDYFNQKRWYVGKIQPDDFSEDILNQYEKANAALISKYEKDMGYK